MSLAVRIAFFAAPVAAAWLWYAMALHREQAVVAVQTAAVESPVAAAPAQVPPSTAAWASASRAATDELTPGFVRARAGAPAGPTLAARFEGAQDYRALYDELLKSDSPAAKYFLGRILLVCSDVAASSVETIVQRFSEWVPADASNRDTRVAAFRRLKEPCAGFSGRRGDSTNPFELFAEGARRGDPRAQARQLWADTAAPIEGRMEAARRLLGHSDPYVVQNLSQFVGATQGSRMVIDGLRLEPSATSAAQLAWDLVVCDMGGACGPNGDRLLTYCAFDGLCSFDSYEDLMRSAFAADFERIDDYRSKIHAALVARDAAALGIAGSDSTPRR